MNKKYAILFLLLTLTLCFNVAAHAEADTAGNLFLTNDEPITDYSRDLFWIGDTRSIAGTELANDVFLAGRSLAVSSSKVDGNVLSAGISFQVSNTTVNGNILVAGYTLQISKTQAAGVYLAGKDVYFEGEADRIVIFAQTASVEGHIHGDLSVTAENITLSPDLVVDGNVNIRSSSEPEIPESLASGSYSYSEIEKPEVAADAKNTEEVSSSTEPEENKRTNVKNPGKFWKFLRGFFSALLVTAFISLLIGKNNLPKAGKMLLTRPVYMLGSGLIALFIAPAIILILVLSKIGGATAGFISLLLTLACGYGICFTGATVANALMPKFTKNEILNHYIVSSLTGCAVLWILRKIPFLKGLVVLASMAYTLGYFIQTIILRLRTEKEENRQAKAIAEEEDIDPVLKQSVIPVQEIKHEDIVERVIQNNPVEVIPAEDIPEETEAAAETEEEEL